MFLALALMVGFVSCGKEKHTFEIKDGKFLYDGEKVQLICGEMHYPRIPVEYWRDRMQRAKAMGLNTVSAYVFWLYTSHSQVNSTSRVRPTSHALWRLLPRRVSSCCCVQVHTYAPSLTSVAILTGCRRTVQ